EEMPTADVLGPAFLTVIILICAAIVTNLICAFCLLCRRDVDEMDTYDELVVDM
uniref:BI1-like protein n=1 Tax=Steinernema glaseri TaxID=37863 RepID=A0A1I7YHB3_9BILA